MDTHGQRWAHGQMRTGSLRTESVFFFRPGNFTSSTIQLTSFVGYS